ncbi:hypothetical protein [Pelosinus propionicus]|uniref:Uncharacterized protein n=1 Tax=Pelosinus propionicus DSM 13327 TaxID=1123291 RepID=A0A1I4LIQ7_9FIRM|nr:hypothetical protein [Pelosinus propionicus]SFL90850.1 hypothetical protein SAMN04490355_102514 [Pelosinus propionicus DSM 13327]
MEILKIVMFEACSKEKSVIQELNSFGVKVDKFSQNATLEKENDKNKILWRGELWDKLIIRYNLISSEVPFHIMISEGEESETFSSWNEEESDFFGNGDDEEAEDNIKEEKIDEDFVEWEMLHREDIDFAVISQDKNVKRKTFKILKGGKK